MHIESIVMDDMDMVDARVLKDIVEENEHGPISGEMVGVGETEIDGEGEAEGEEDGFAGGHVSKTLAST